MGLLSGLLGHASEISQDKVREELGGVLLSTETVQIAFRVIRDLMVFTEKRMILVDKQGLTGRKVTYHSVPYRAITAFAVETAGRFDLDAELKIWISGRTGPMEITLKKGTNVLGIQAAIASAL